MKIAVFLLTIATMNNALAFLIGCSDTVSISVSQALHSDPNTNEVVESVKLTRLFPSTQSNVCRSSRRNGRSARSEWIVVTVVGPMATCTVETVLQDWHVE